MDSFLISSLIIMLGLMLGIIISCRWYITKMAIFSEWFAMQQSRSGMLDSIRNDRSVRNSERNAEHNQNQIYCIDRDQLPRLDYNEVMNQSKEMDLPTYEEAVKQYQKQPPQITVV
ncbi:uncharacterized protein LOC119081548 isoform X1 [Bradysia coprophila]|uniref:uncharacterized protein LOC119081548 isoform X1 n=1 Tax=Bradysia coprophila TaxID=38358 RepID=UPI00187D6F5F|nr:uncharacterized protein LOC119081548 isoform X1 [Bradysia coprophila]